MDTLKVDLHALRCDWPSSTSSGVAWRCHPTGWCAIRVCSPMTYLHFGAPGSLPLSTRPHRTEVLSPTGCASSLIKDI